MLPLKVLTSLALEVIQKNQLVAQDVTIQKRGAGSLHDVSHGVSRVSQPPGYGYGVRGTEGAEDRGTGERCFSGWTSEVICVEVVQYVACRIAWKPSVRNDDET